ncbi:MAG: hypothetical protein CMM18_00435 [Rhodospirillaceae bacterium]|nr:hypothetical protein [Rhodospirillaceae bacterium]
MSDFEKSRENFEEALLNLEQMVDQVYRARLEEKQSNTKHKIDSLPEDPIIVQKERDELKVKLNEITESYDALSSVTSQLSIRLDNTIKKLRSILE